MVLALRKQSSARETTTQKIIRLVKLHGDFPLAFSTLQGNLSYHFYGDIGFVAYTRFGRTIFVLGDPVISGDNLRNIIVSFNDKFPKSVWVQTHFTTANILRTLGYNLSPIGIESTVELPFSLSGKYKADLRVLVNSATREELEVREIDSSLSKIKHIENRMNFSFLVATKMREQFSDIRYFGGFKNGEIAGYSLFHPYYLDNKIIGYHEIIPQRYGNSPKGSRVLILVKAMEQFASEGVQFLNLGLSPLRPGKISDEFSCSMTNKVSYSVRENFSKIIFNYGNFFFNFKGLAFHKSRFRGIETSTYLASKNSYSLTDFAKLYRLTTGSWLPRI